jgi:ubiquinone/menaquinone biosynthesis C-methylase UbiE
VAKSKREIAFLYDLYIAPTWRDCFDRLFNEKIGLPKEGKILDVNCGTGGHALEIALGLNKKGQVTAMEQSAEMIKIAHAKAVVAKVGNINFFVGDPRSLAFPPQSFDLIICDATMLAPDKFTAQLKELVRVANPGAKIVLNTTTRGSFGEFYSIFWEALYECDLAEKLLAPLEALINERPTISDMEELMEAAGLKAAQTFQEREEFLFDDAAQFFAAPLIENYMLDKWLGILPRGAKTAVRAALERIIERERDGHQFDVSIKAALISADKPL